MEFNFLFGFSLELSHMGRLNFADFYMSAKVATETF